MGNKSFSALFFSSWFLAVFLPYFHQIPIEIDYAMGLLVIFPIFYFHSSRNPLNFLGSKIQKVFFFVPFGCFLISILLKQLGFSKVYALWCRLGADPMVLKEKIFVFGDLEHLTSAASCKRAISNGIVICDPWGRLFNQNPLVGNIFRKLHFTNSLLIGFVSSLILMFVLCRAARFLEIQNSWIFVSFLSPVFVLALDRGNEIITLCLITLGVYFLLGKRAWSQYLGAFFLISASIFKLWPMFLLIGIILFLKKSYSRLVLTFLGAGIIYWILITPTVLQMIQATQQGSPFGLSFGLKLFWDSRLSSVQIGFLLTVTLSLLLLMIYLGNSSLRPFLKLGQQMVLFPWVLIFMFTYIAIWLFGNSFIYRLIILIPLLFLLSSKQFHNFAWAQFGVALIMTCLMVVRLPIGLSVTGALALYFIYVIVLFLYTKLMSRSFL